MIDTKHLRELLDAARLVSGKCARLLVSGGGDVEREAWGRLHEAVAAVNDAGGHDMFDEIEALQRELHRIACGETIDGDGMCPHELTVVNQRQRIEALEGIQGICDHQAKLLAELPPSADQLIQAEMAAAVAKTEVDCMRRRLEALERVAEAARARYRHVKRNVHRLLGGDPLDVAVWAALDALDGVTP